MVPGKRNTYPVIGCFTRKRLVIIKIGWLIMVVIHQGLVLGVNNIFCVAKKMHC